MTSLRGGEPTGRGIDTTAGLRYGVSSKSLSGISFAGPRSGLPPGTQVVDASSPVGMPDVHGLGLAYRAKGGHLTLAFEWDRVEYATIMDSIDPEHRLRAGEGSSILVQASRTRIDMHVHAS